MLADLWFRIKALLGGRRMDREFTDEIAFHLAMETQDLIRKGVDPAEARRRARVAFGGVERYRERARDVRGVRFIDDIVQDLRFGARQLAKNPLFTVGVLLTLAVGIGANTAVFSVVRNVLLQPFPYANPDRLVVVLSQGADGGTGPTSGPDFLDWRERADAFDALAAYSSGPVNFTGLGEPERLVGARVSGEMFEVFGEGAVLGRTLLPGDETSAEGPVVVLGHGFWSRSFGSDPAILGRGITLNGEVHTVVGVMPESFNLPVPWAGYDLWTSLRLEDLKEQRDWRHLGVVGRLRSAAGIEAAESELQALATTLFERYPGSNSGVTAIVRPLKIAYLGNLRRPLFLFVVAAGAVLLIVCANVAGLFLARASSRNAEVAMRSALGATRGRLARQFLSESALVSLLGGVLGFLVAWAVLRGLEPLLSSTLPRAGPIRMDRWVLSFTLAISLGTTILLSIAPASIGAGADPLGALAHGRTMGSNGPSRNRLRRAFLGAQFALALLLANGAALMLRSFFALQKVEPGFSSENVLTFSLAPEGGRYEEARERQTFFEETLQRIKAIPGVESAGASSKLPLEGGSNTKVMIAGREGEFIPEEAPLIELSRIMPGFLEALKIPLLAGRYLEAGDFETDPPGILINSTMAERLFPDTDPMGQRMSWETGDPSWLAVVGVVGDVRQWGLEQAPQPEMYVPFSVLPRPRMYVVVRSTGDPLALVPAIRREVFNVDGLIPVSDVRTMEQVLSGTLSYSRFNALLVGLMAGISLILVAAGVYGIVSYYATQHIREIGIRMAMGAGRATTITHVMRRGLGPAVVGIGCGAMGFLAAARLLRSLLYGVEPTDLRTLSGSGILLLALGLLACLGPASKAARMNVVEAVGKP